MIESYITRPTVFPMEAEEPWRIVENLCENITHLIEILDDEFDVKDGVAPVGNHRSQRDYQSPGDDLGKLLRRQ